MAGKSASLHGPRGPTDVLSSPEVFDPTGTGLTVQKSSTPGLRTTAGPIDANTVSGPKDKATGINFPSGQGSQTQRHPVTMKGSQS